MIPRRAIFWTLLLCITASNALHFYLDANEKRCFIEELPMDTVVEGEYSFPTKTLAVFNGPTGHYRALEWSEDSQTYEMDENLGIIVEVDELDSGHSVVKTRGPSEGRFTFTSHEAGDHTICLSTNYTSWFSSTHLRLYLDVVVGQTKADADHDRSHVSELASKIRDLNQKLEDIYREQSYQRQREADYRNLSEATNSRAVWYSIAQILVLVGTCTWQLRHLKRFFEDRKMR
ncbi:Membrane protein [Mycena indigotica]|uniref:Membrane protein n=1 Tax=Mycena indigotica TaxID=2126181 RepID=A0A8H6W8H8_9AGAR|nr:Membrane protein [Mycena indigotica]KAF7309674.1 Membrane protein [Mycena indigotica]